MIVAVLLTGLVLSAGPLLFDRLAQDALQDAIASPPPQLRNIDASMMAITGASSDNDPFRNVRLRGERFREAELPPSVQQIIESDTWVIDSPRFLISAIPAEGVDPVFPSFIRLRYQEDIADHVSLEEGRMPAPAEPVLVELGEDCPLTGDEEDPEALDCAEVRVPVFEVAVTRETLDYLPVDVGGEMLLTPDSCRVRRCGGPGSAIVDDDAYFAIPSFSLQYRIVVRIAGLLGIDDADAEYWYGDPRLHRPRIVSNADFTVVYGTGLMAPEVYRAVQRQTGRAQWSHTWRYFVDPERIVEDEVEQLTADLSTLLGEFPPSSFFDTGHMEVRTKLPDLLEEYVDQREVAVAMLSMSVTGVLAIAVGLILTLASLVTERQRRGLVLLRSRGASRIQLVAWRGWQGLMITAPPALLAHYLAMALVPGPEVAPARLGVGLVAVATVFIVVASGSVSFGDLGALERTPGLPRRASSRRLVFDGFVVALAVGAVVVVRRRGSVGTGGESFDALVAAAPVLLALAVGLLTLRLYPFPIRLLAWVGSRLRGSVVFVGFRRVLQQPAVARLPLVVMLLSVAMAVFSWIVRDSITDVQREATWQETGAPYRLNEPNPANALVGSPDLSRLESVEATAVGFLTPDARTYGEIGSAPATVHALFVDAPGLAAVNAGTPADPRFPTFMTEVDHAGTLDDPIPVIASKRWSAVAPAAGDVFGVTLGRGVVFLEVAEVRETFPGMPADRPFVVGSADALERSNPLMVARPTVMYVRADPDALEELEATVRRTTPTTVVSSQAASLSGIRDAPFSRGIDRGLLLTSWLATAFGAVTAASSLALGSARRRRDFAYLRAQGLDRRQAAWLTVIEHAPAISAAAALGALLGVGIGFVLGPAINLKAFSGGGGDVGFVIDAGAIALMGLALAMALAATAGIFAWIRREADLGGLLRIGDE
jgi:putative ABC transport system permease protein